MLGAMATPAVAAFPGKDGLLAVQPLQGSGVVLIAPDGSGERRECAEACGYVGVPRFSPGGRSLVFATASGLKLIGLDGSCLDCEFGFAVDPGFTSDGTEVTFVSGGQLVEDGIDGLPTATLLEGGISDAVWSSQGELAVVRGGRIWTGKPGSLRLFGRGASPSWSPAGTRLAFVRDGWVIVRGPRGSRRLARGTAPAFAPDGNAIAYIGRDHAVEIIGIGGGRNRRVGRVRARSVDWQPFPATASSCLAPSGSTVIARSSDAVVTERSVPDPEGPVYKGEYSYAYMGCLLSNGEERLLEKFTPTPNTDDGTTSVAAAGIGGPYAALVNYVDDAHYDEFSDTVAEFDLRTGRAAQTGLNPLSCPNSVDYSPYDCGLIDQIVVTDDGAYAVHTQGQAQCSNGETMCWLETIVANDHTGPTTLDEVLSQGVAPGPFLTNMAISGNTLTWDHDGSPRSAELQ